MPVLALQYVAVLREKRWAQDRDSPIPAKQIATAAKHVSKTAKKLLQRADALSKPSEELTALQMRVRKVESALSVHLANPCPANDTTKDAWSELPFPCMLLGRSFWHVQSCATSLFVL